MEIIFTPQDPTTEAVLDKPSPAVKYLPKWYREAPLHLDGDKVDGLAKENQEASNLTIKGCSPFLDALSFGYMYELPFDLEFRCNEDGKRSIRWGTGLEIVSGHSAEQHPGLPLPFDADDLAMKETIKWRFTFRIKTPPGYSCLFTHPLNRHELPFRVFSGVVDTDTYPAAVEFPFQFLKDFNEPIFVLEKGTPLVQIIPFKRDEWTSKQEPFNAKESLRGRFMVSSKAARAYKTQFWKKKSFS